MEDLKNHKIVKLRDGCLPGSVQYTCVEEIIGCMYMTNSVSSLQHVSVHDAPPSYGQ